MPVRHERYTHVLLDLDRTIFDTDTSLVLAFEDAMTVVGADPAGQYPTFQQINNKLWLAVETGTLTAPDVHTARFEQLIDALQLNADADAMAGAFADGLARHGDLFEGARTMLDALSEMTLLALVTNGLSSVQRARIDRLELNDYFAAIVISAEVGVAKPNPKIFEIAFQALARPPRAATVMVGNSLSSDIAGGNSYGISTCWYNPRHLPSHQDHAATHEISSLEGLLDIVQEPS